MFEVWKEKLNPVGTPKTWLGLKPQEKKLDGWSSVTLTLMVGEMKDIHLVQTEEEKEKHVATIEKVEEREQRGRENQEERHHEGEQENKIIL